MIPQSTLDIQLTELWMDLLVDNVCEVRRVAAQSISHACHALESLSASSTMPPPPPAAGDNVSTTTTTTTTTTTATTITLALASPPNLLSSPHPQAPEGSWMDRIVIPKCIELAQSPKYSDRTLSLFLLTYLLQSPQHLPPPSFLSLWVLLLQSQDDKVANVRLRLSRSLGELPLSFVGQMGKGCVEVLNRLAMDPDRDVKLYALRARARLLGDDASSSSTTTSRAIATAAGGLKDEKGVEMML